MHRRNPPREHEEIIFTISKALRGSTSTSCHILRRTASLKASGALRQRGKERKNNAPPAGGWRLFLVVRSACVPSHRETLMPTREDSQQHKLLSDSSCLMQLFEKFQNSSLPCFNTGPGREINCSLTSCLPQSFEEFQNSSLPVTNTVEKDSMLQHQARTRDKLLSDCNCLANLLKKNRTALYQ